MKSPLPLPASQNESYGFWGTLNERAAAAWPIALPAIATATGADPEAVRLFLDSRYGRHFADDVLNHLHAGRRLPEAIPAAIAQWMTWKIGRRTTRDTGIPRGLPYLTGFVLHCEMTDALSA
jgi:hypothetical protein